MTTATPSDNSIPSKSNGKRMVPRKAGEIGSSAEKVDPTRGLGSTRQTPSRSGKKKGPVVSPSLAESNIILVLGQSSKTKRGHSASPRAGKSAGTGTADKSKPRRSKKSWEPIATFVVEFQSRAGKGGVAERRTHAHHHEADRDMDWPGVAGREVYRWMMKQIGEDSDLADDTQALAGQVEPKLPATEKQSPEFRAESGTGVEPDVRIAVSPPTISVGPPRIMTSEEVEKFKKLPGTVKATMKMPLVEPHRTDAAPESGATKSKGQAALDETPRSTGEAAPSVEASAALLSAALEIRTIRVTQPPDDGQVADLYLEGRTLSGLVRGGIPLAFSVGFAVLGTAAAEATKGHKEFGVVVYAEDLSTHTSSLLGSSIPNVLMEGCLTYTAWLPPLTMSPGVYRLKVVATVRDSRPLWTHAEVMLLQVL